MLLEEPAGGYQSFTDLEAWKLARALKRSVWQLLSCFPEAEKFELASQLRRAVRSVPAALAEGYGRFTYKDQSNFCVIARGSLSEVLNHLIDAFDCGYISSESLSDYKNQIDQLGKVLNGYLTYLRSKQKSG